MIKNSRIEVDKTPSEDTGKPCSKIIKGDPLSESLEGNKDFEKIAKDIMLDPAALKKPVQFQKTGNRPASR
jgi:hypothetical protein